MSRKRLPTPQDEATAAKALIMLENVKPRDEKSAKALDNLKKYLREQVGLDVYQH
jgi:hypothetical protein